MLELSRRVHARGGRRRQRLLEEEIELDKKFKHTIEVVVDRLVMKRTSGNGSQSIETATSLAAGLVVVDVLDGALPDGSNARGALRA